jgi:hypothetical protein
LQQVNPAVQLKLEFLFITLFLLGLLAVQRWGLEQLARLEHLKQANQHLGLFLLVLHPLVLFVSGLAEAVREVKAILEAVYRLEVAAVAVGL